MDDVKLLKIKELEYKEVEKEPEEVELLKRMRKNILSMEAKNDQGDKFSSLEREACRGAGDQILYSLPESPLLCRI
jgi:hypothetical protein